MTLEELMNHPDFVSANPATRQAIFDEYAPYDPNYTRANPATQAAIREAFGLPAPAGPVAPTTMPGDTSAQDLATSLGGIYAGGPITAAAYGQPTGAAQAARDTAGAVRSGIGAVSRLPAGQVVADVAGMAGGVGPLGTAARLAGQGTQAAGTTIGDIASGLGSAARTAGNVGLRVAGRLAGPAGLAMGVKDAFDFAQEAQLGERLAQGQGRLAGQAYRNLANQNVSGYIPTAQEAANLLASGDERTIQIYGGRDRLKQIVDGAMRGAAAQRVLPR